MTTSSSSLPSMECPLCGHNEGLHIDSVRARSSGGTVLELTKEAKPRFLDPGDHVGSSRRAHCFTLVGWCEMCSGRFAFDLAQHKGETQLAVTRLPGSPHDEIPGSTPSDAVKEIVQVMGELP